MIDILLLLIALLLGIVAMLLLRLRRMRREIRETEARVGAAEDRMRVSIERAERAAKEKTNFLATMSHEIRTPLNAIVGFSEFLCAPVVPQARLAECSRGIALSANVLLSLINDILDLSKVESGRTEGLDIRAGDCDVQRLLAEMDSVFRLRIEQKGLAFTLKADGAMPRLAVSEPRLRQVLLNLIGNAFKFTERGSIAVRAAYADERLRLTVADTGIGISPRGLERIFEPFAQDLRVRGGKVYEGTGLGLPIVKRLVEASSGTVAVESVVGKGSTFTVEIPGVRALERQTPPRANTVSFATTRVFREVIVVDDVAMNRKVLQMHCMALGIPAPRLFASGLEALDWLAERENACDLVLTDVWMPQMDGAELAQRIARIRPDLPVVAVTADTDAAASFNLSRFRGLLTKPVSADKLAALLAALPQ